MHINWVGFLPAVILVSLIPGANQLLGFSNAVRYGTVHAVAGLAGRLAAFVVLIALVVGGLGAVLATSATALEVIKWVGVVYLAWLGVSTLRGARSATAPVTPSGLRTSGLWAVSGREFLVALSNPKALLLFAALLPQFTGGSPGHAAAQLALLGLVYLGIEAIVGLGYIGAGRRIGGTGLTARTQRRVDVGTGVTFLGLSGLLAAEDLA
ncbi:LysE family translocator [Cryptosporangium japonicum]|uniref:LysE family translocator n=1 Tax=Cryptosporangium japonicum TaxID=80872 RepID=UPI0031D0F055